MKTSLHIGLIVKFKNCAESFINQFEPEKKKKKNQ